MKKKRETLRAAGLSFLGVWMENRLLESARTRARALNVPLSAVHRAALEHGLRLVSTSEIIATERRLRAVIGYPCVSRHPGVPEDRSRAFDFKKWNRERRLAKEMAP